MREAVDFVSGLEVYDIDWNPEDCVVEVLANRRDVTRLAIPRQYLAISLITFEISRGLPRKKKYLCFSFSDEKPAKNVNYHSRSACGSWYWSTAANP